MILQRGSGTLREGAPVLIINASGYAGKEEAELVVVRQS
jgi:hypothetical protein